MATIAQTTEELDLLRKELFDAARVMTDPDERAKLQAAVAEIDALLDKLAVSVLHKTEAKLGPLRQRVEVLTDDAEERPSEPKAVANDPIAKKTNGSGPSESPKPARATTVDHTPSTREDGGLILKETHLIALWKRSVFPIDDRGVIVFGIRGCLPVDYAGTGFGREHEIQLSPINYRTMNCTIGLWRPSEGFALFPGSTVPFASAVAGAVSSGGSGVNQLGRGRYANYVPGWHKRAEGQNGHWALLQECPITLQRTTDDTDFDLIDRWEVGRIAGDNIHCAFHMGPDAAIPTSRYSSAGCQVVAGTVKKGVAGSERGPWAKFVAPFLSENAAASKGVEYVLFDGVEVQQMIKNRCMGKAVILRIGSRGPLVRELRRRLASRLERSMSEDTEFDSATFQAVIDFQSSVFGANSDDGIVGQETALELGFELPLFDFDDAVNGGSGLRDPRAAELNTVTASVTTSITTDDLDAIAWGGFAERRCGPGFKQKVVSIAGTLGCDPNHLMAVMAFETGGTFASDVRNAAGSGAVGLIQFMPKTAESLSTTTARLAKLSPVEQLDFVERYFKSVTGDRRLATLSDVYMAVLFPAAVGKAESFVLFKQPSVAYRQNRGLDVNGDGVITKAESAAMVMDHLVKGMDVGNLG